MNGDLSLLGQAGAQLPVEAVDGSRLSVARCDADVAVDSEATRRRGKCRLNYARIPEARGQMESARERGKIGWYEGNCSGEGIRERWTCDGEGENVVTVRWSCLCQRRAGLVFLLQVKGVQKFGTPRSLPRKSYRAFAAAAPLTGVSWQQMLHVIGAGGRFKRSVWGCAGDDVRDGVEGLELRHGEQCGVWVASSCVLKWYICAMEGAPQTK